MNSKAAPHLEFAPPPQPGAGRAWLAAGLVHALLFLALGLATAWKTQPQTVQAEAELWSATPQAAAPRLQEPPPEPEPEPAPQPKPAPATPPPPPAPDLAQERLDAQIALEKKKQQEKKKEAEKAEKLKAEKEKAAKEKLTKEQAEKEKAELKRKEREKEREKEDKAKEKAAKEKKAQEEKERDKKKAAEKASAEKADAARADALRKENLKRMQGMAGASGGENATGTALKSSGPSASYAGRLVGRIKPNITYPGDVVGNPRAEVEVKVGPDGMILSRRIVQSSGNKAWDDAVLRAIDKTEIVPKDTDGRVPPVIVLGFRPLD
ncbi:cell envelope integrity protein TolA [Limnohabitans sp. T6-20]|uniref:cell envelope integrity protein TolA n=1 Tax=Limnohabitans sp. T6-20 TaxID=1100725 RepID=UPI000D35A75A|nr:cell envelope integrity protein TolA [Limnohabitans sp. T6-20]PUE07612.1 protein TolA [Limnohabitans sp. T6-20]